HHLVRRHPGLIVDNAVELRTELALEDGGLQANYRAADDLRLVVELVDSKHEANRAERIRTQNYNVRIRRLQGTHNRREVGCAGREGFVIDNLRTEGLCVLAGTLAGVPRELCVLSRQRNRCRLWILLFGNLEYALGE